MDLHCLLRLGVVPSGGGGGAAGGRCTLLPAETDSDCFPFLIHSNDKTIGPGLLLHSVILGIPHDIQPTLSAGAK